MNIRQHISIHLERVTRVLLPGGWQLGFLLAEFSLAQLVALHATKNQVMPCRDCYRGNRKA